MLVEERVTNSARGGRRRDGMLGGVPGQQSLHSRCQTAIRDSRPNSVGKGMGVGDGLASPWHACCLLLFIYEVNRGRVAGDECAQNQEAIQQRKNSIL